MNLVQMMPGPGHMLAQRTMNPVPHQLTDTSQLKAVEAAVGSFRSDPQRTQQVNASDAFCDCESECSIKLCGNAIAASLYSHCNGNSCNHCLI
jgi:hypothetical protein